METENTVISNKEIKIEAENSCRENEVKVTKLLSEISTTDLPKESPIQVERKEEGDNNKLVNEDNGDKKVDHEKKKVEEVEKVDDGNKKVDESKKVDNGDKKTDEPKNSVNGDKKTNDSTEVEKDEKKVDDYKKADSGDKKEDGSKKVEKEVKKVEESKKVEKEGKKVEESKKVEKEGKKVEESKKVEKEGKKVEESKKVEKEGKKVEESKKVEKEGKNVEESKKVGKKPDDNKKIDAKNKSIEKSSKQEKVSPLAAYFKDWDKFTVYQKIDIERLIIKKAEEMGAPSKTKPGVRTYDEKDRMRFRWNAIRMRRQSRRFKESLGLEGSQSLRDRRSPIRLRGTGDSRSRYPGDNRRYRYSPRREMPWRSPWSSPAVPVENLIKQMERFVQMVDTFPKPIHRQVPGNMIHEGLKGPALLPTPPHGYNFALRGNNGPTENKPRDYLGNNYAPPQSRWSVQQFTVKGEEPSRRFLGKEPSSKSLPKPRPSPYNNRPYSSTTQRKDNWSSQDRGYSKNSGIRLPTPYNESRFNYGTPYRR